MIHADTEGLLDRCQCGAVAGFEHDTELGYVRARCTECCESGCWSGDIGIASAIWNQFQRQNKPVKEPRHE